MSKGLTLLCAALITAVFCCAAAATVFAGEMDILVNKLVEKGVLTDGEAQQMLTETKEQARKEIAQAKNEVLPKWLQTTKFGGDLRLRYQGETKTGSKHRDRGRMRLRYGFETRPNDQMKVALKMASGEEKNNNGPEQTSTNASFNGAFANKHLWIDQAYLEYNPFRSGMLIKDLKLTGGKFPNPYYATDLVWDGDINPEGGVLSLTPSAAGVDYFFTFGFHPLYESSSNSDDAKLYALQGGFGTKLVNRPFKLGVAYYNFDDIKGYTFATFSPNYTPTTLNTNGTTITYDFNVLAVTAEFSPVDINLLDWTMPLVIHGDYANNLVSGASYDTTWLAGFKLGKAREKGTWEVYYNYRQIERDAVVSFLNDSDFHLGGTGSKGHKFGLVYALMPNSTLGCNYFITRDHKVNSSSRKIDLYQVDWVTKF